MINGVAGTHDGLCLITGEFEGSLTLGQGENATTLISAGSVDAFIARCSADGSFD